MSFVHEEGKNAKKFFYTKGMEEDVCTPTTQASDRKDSTLSSSSDYNKSLTEERNTKMELDETINSVNTDKDNRNKEETIESKIEYRDMVTKERHRKPRRKEACMKLNLIIQKQ